MTTAMEFAFLHTSMSIGKFVGVFAVPPEGTLAVEDLTKSLHQDLAELQDAFTDKNPEGIKTSLMLIAARSTVLVIALYLEHDPKTIAEFIALDYDHVPADKMDAYLHTFLAPEDWDLFDE